MRYVVAESRLGSDPEGEPEAIVATVVRSRDDGLQLAANRVVAVRGHWTLDDQGVVVARGKDGCHYRWDVNPID
jgi:hypothetical protein